MPVDISMRALVLNSYNASFEQTAIRRPEPAPGQVLVRIKASGVNPLDIKIRRGEAAHAKQPLPAILGLDMAGVVESVGDSVNAFNVGDEVYGVTGGVGGLQGSLAEFAAVDADLLAKKPSNLTMRQAAALPLSFITAWEGLVDRAGVHAGQKVLIHAGAGGVGHVAVQIAHAMGADVFATVSPEKREFAERFGAKPIDYRSTTVEEYVGACTGGEGFDIVYDTLGGPTLDASFKAVRVDTGHVVSCMGWGAHALAPLSFRGATYSGVFTLLPMLTGKGRAHHGEIMREATRLAEEGKLVPLLDSRRFTFETVLDAYCAVEDGTAVAKIIVDVAEG
jgi:NADPH2:quinone reductase